MWLSVGGVAIGQTGSGASYTATIEALCRQYAAAQRGMPADAAFGQCMVERHCRASLRAARLPMRRSRAGELARWRLLTWPVFAWVRILSDQPAACRGDATLPLTGIRVVDLTRILAGPFCSMMLADMGAEIVKIETPGSGDPVRRQGAIRDGLSWYFAAFNRNKRSLTLNLRHPEGRAVLEKLIAQGDVLVENFRPGVLGGDGVRQGAARRAEPGACLLQPHRLRRERALSRPAVLRFHRPGDERVYERHRRARRRADARRSADRRPRRRALRRAWDMRGIGAPRPHRRGRHGRRQPQQRHDQHARLSRGELFRDRRAAGAQRQRPCDRLALRHVPHQGRRDRDRPVAGAVLSAAGRCARHARIARPPRFPHQRLCVSKTGRR